MTMAPTGTSFENIERMAQPLLDDHKLNDPLIPDAAQRNRMATFPRNGIFPAVLPYRDVANYLPVVQGQESRRRFLECCGTVSLNTLLILQGVPCISPNHA